PLRRRPAGALRAGGGAPARRRGARPRAAGAAGGRSRSGRHAAAGVAVDGGGAVDLEFLPAVNAGLNALATVLLVRGRRLARVHRIDAHRRTMLAAFAVSSLFLVLYVLHKWS